MRLNSIPLYTLTLSITTLLYIPSRMEAAPTATQKDSKRDFEMALDRLLTTYYEEFLAKEMERSKTVKVEGNSDSKVEPEQKVNIYDQMQGDQPVSEGTIFMANPVEITRKAREEHFSRYRQEYLQQMKEYLSGVLGRGPSASNAKPPENPFLPDYNITAMISNDTNATDYYEHFITEKIRSFHPDCEQLQNQEQWKDLDDMMDLSFDLGTISDTRNSNIASATFRLYRLPQNNTDTEMEAEKDDCKNLDGAEEEKLLRVSVYWYMKSQKKRRFKKRISDSKVVPENTPWVELSVKPATKSWNRASNTNLRLGILVEDQESKVLRADKYFKGASCTVGVTTPIPIPSLVRDASEAGELNELAGQLGRNGSTSSHRDVPVPTVDVCYLEVPTNMDISQFDSARINACNLRKAHEEKQRLIEQERLERRLATETLLRPNARHIRHQRQHHQSQLDVSELVQDFEKLGKDRRQISDLERNMKNMMNSKQIVLTRAELESLQRDRSLDR